MIKKLQQRLILITMVSLLSVMTVVVVLINGINLYRIDQRAESLLNVLSEHSGHFPETTVEVKIRPAREWRPEFQLELTEETPFETRYFWVKAADGDIRQANIANIAAVSDDEARAYGQEVLQSGRRSGYLGLYKYRVTAAEDGEMVIFVDCSSQLNGWLTFLLISVMVAGCCFAAVMLLVALLSRKVLAPMIDNIEKQKQFVMDAGHELKTPLAIISANADVLELEGGDNEWLESIRTQTKRLDALVRNLLAMAKMEEESVKMTFVPFSLTDVAKETVESFTTLAETQGLTIGASIAAEVTLRGDEAAIRQLTSILLDNAIKYASSASQITVRLTQSERGNIRLEVQNACSSLPAGNLERLFDRFYRADGSRARQSGGYGIGLSVARAIAQAHKAKITARRIGEHDICFAVNF